MSKKKLELEIFSKWDATSAALDHDCLSSKLASSHEKYHVTRERYRRPGRRVGKVPEVNPSNENLPFRLTCRRKLEQHPTFPAAGGGYVFIPIFDLVLIRERVFPLPENPRSCCCTPPCPPFLSPFLRSLIARGHYADAGCSEQSRACAEKAMKKQKSSRR